MTVSGNGGLYGLHVPQLVGEESNVDIDHCLLNKLEKGVHVSAKVQEKENAIQEAVQQQPLKNQKVSCWIIVWVDYKMYVKLRFTPYLA